MTSAVFADTGTPLHRFEIPVGLSPSSVQPKQRGGQVLSSGSELSREGMLQVSQGGKRESLAAPLPIGKGAPDLSEAVRDPVHIDALAMF